MKRPLNRRSAVAALSGVTLTAAMSPTRLAWAQNAVPWSKGVEKPTVRTPPNATDCHHHIYSSRYKRDPNATTVAPDATIEQYRLLQQRLGLRRNVVIQPSLYGLDNSGLVEVLGTFGLATTRGVAVVSTDVATPQLRTLDAAGVRGVRFNFVNVGKPALTIEMMEPLAKRIAAFGWHFQLNWSGDLIAEQKDLLARLPVPVVFDHLGHLPEPQGTAHPAFAVIAELMAKGRGWVKLTGFYNDTKLGPPTYADSVKIATAFVAAAPRQCLWGTDWPHPTEKADGKPDDALLLDLFGQYVPDETLRTHILVDNPARLYGF